MPPCGRRCSLYRVISDVWEWTPKKLLQWHWEKVGSIKAAHDVIKNELAGGVMLWIAPG